MWIIPINSSQKLLWSHVMNHLLPIILLPLERSDFRQVGCVKLDSSTHSGEDVSVYANGPWSHLFHGTHDQTYVYHVMEFAACVGTSKTECADLERQNWLKKLLGMRLSTLVVISMFCCWEFIVDLVSCVSYLVQVDSRTWFLMRREILIFKDVIWWRSVIVW